MRLMISDARWAVLEPVVAASSTHNGGATPRLSDRMFLEALLYVARTSIAWRDLPSEFGQWSAVYNRFRRWIASGRLERVFTALTADPQFGDVRQVLIDSTICRAHLHAAGARRKKSTSVRTRRPGETVWGGLAAASRPRSSPPASTKTP